MTNGNCPTSGIFSIQLGRKTDISIYTVYIRNNSASSKEKEKCQLQPKRQTFQTGRHKVVGGRCIKPTKHQGAVIIILYVYKNTHTTQ